MESTPRDKGSLHVAENLRFQRAEWTAQRVGSVILVLLVLAALAGFFGNGPASSATASTPDAALAADYERFARQGRSWFLRVQAGDGSGLGTLRLGKTLVDRNEIEQIVPQPDRSTSTPDGLVVAYDTPASEVRVRLRPTGMGWFTCTVGSGPRSVEMRQLVYY